MKLPAVSLYLSTEWLIANKNYRRWWVLLLSSYKQTHLINHCIISTLFFLPPQRIVYSTNSLRPSNANTSINQAIIGFDNVLAPNRRQAIIWTSAGVCRLNHREQNSVKFESKFWHFHSGKHILQNVHNFFSASMIRALLYCRWSNSIY